VGVQTKTGWPFMCSLTHFAWKEFILLPNAKSHISIMMITAVILNTTIANVSITFAFTRFSTYMMYIIVPKLTTWPKYSCSE
jgi:hypothetical protein